MESEEHGKASKHIVFGWIEQSKNIQRISKWVDKRKGRRLNCIDLDQIKQIGLGQEDQTKQSIADESNKSWE